MSPAGVGRALDPAEVLWYHRQFDVQKSENCRRKWRKGLDLENIGDIVLSCDAMCICIYLHVYNIYLT